MTEVMGEGVDLFSNPKMTSFNMDSPLITKAVGNVVTDLPKKCITLFNPSMKDVKIC